MELASLSINQLVQLFILAMGILVFCNFVSMISLWIVSSKLSDIKDLLAAKRNQSSDIDKSEE